jgi:hypothetical protein
MVSDGIQSIIRYVHGDVNECGQKRRMKENECEKGETSSSRKVKGRAFAYGWKRNAKIFTGLYARPDTAKRSRLQHR